MNNVLNYHQWVKEVLLVIISKVVHRVNIQVAHSIPNNTNNLVLVNLMQVLRAGLEVVINHGLISLLVVLWLLLRMIPQKQLLMQILLRGQPIMLITRITRANLNLNLVKYLNSLQLSHRLNPRLEVDKQITVRHGLNIIDP